MKEQINLDIFNEQIPANNLIATPTASHYDAGGAESERDYIKHNDQ